MILLLFLINKTTREELDWNHLFEMDKSLKISGPQPRREQFILSSGHESSSRDSTPNELFPKDQTREIMNVTQNAKNAVNRNKLKLVSLLNFLTIGGIIFSLAFPRWAYVYPEAGNTDNYYSVGLLKDVYYTNQQPVSSDFLWVTRRKACDSNNEEVCKLLGPFVFAGIGSTIMVHVALVVQCLGIAQIGLIAFRKGCCLRECFSPEIMQLGVLLLYGGGFAFWYFASGFFTKLFKGEFFSALGPGLASYIGSVLFYIILMIWFHYLFQKARRNAKLNELLDAENQLLAELDEAMLDQDASLPKHNDVLL